MTFNEANTVRDFVKDQAQLGPWEYQQSNQLPRQHSEVLIETWLREALIRLNPAIAEVESRADEVIHRLYSVIQSGREGLLAANEEFAAWLKGEKTMPFGPDGQHETVYLLDLNSPENNLHVVSTEVTYSRGQVERRFDLVFFVNGIPVILGEAKSPVRPAYSWVDAASQLHDDYEKNIPLFFVPAVLEFATEGKEFYYGTVGNAVGKWGPWRKDQPGEIAVGLQTVREAVEGLLNPNVLLDFLRFFTVFATDSKHRKIKIVARYQQFLAANAMVARVKEGRIKKGLIWHFQGSGKSLLMVFTAQKLRATAELRAPTVLIVVDRLDLDSQISDTFTATDVANVISTDSRQHLQSMLRAGSRKIIITTIHKFSEANGVLDDRQNIVAMVDEAHRTQEGDLGRQMREALPNAFLFGLTGTPINKRDRNTFYAFGHDGDDGGYMSKYSFSDSIRDGATLPLHFEPRLVDLDVDQAAIDEGFVALAEELDEGERALLSARAANTAHLLKASDRIEKVAADIAEHFTTKVRPQNFKGQVVVLDKEACVMMKAALDQHLPQEASTVVMSMDARDPQEWRDAYARDKEQEKKLLEDFRDPAHPLHLLIVTAKLLTGFDAPILQALYLDKPLRDHTLLQAICRTNRTFPGKTHGLVIDYLGIFDDVAQAMMFDDEQIRTVISNINSLKSQLEPAMMRALTFFTGVDRSVEGWQGLQEAQSKLPDNQTKDSFAKAYSEVAQLWEAISPDPILAEFKQDYRWLTDVYESVRPADQTGKLVWHALGAKTLDLINEHVRVEVPRDDLETIVLDAKTLGELSDGSPATTTTIRNVEVQIAGRLAKHGDDPVFKALGERLLLLKAKYEGGQQASLDFLRDLLELARDTVAAEKKILETPREDRGRAALTELFRSVKSEETPIIVERVVADIDDVVRAVRFEGWQETAQGDREVQQALRKTLYVRYKLRDQNLFERAHAYIREYY